MSAMRRRRRGGCEKRSAFRETRNARRETESMYERTILSFEQDSDGVWIATLACGHTQHVRHEPPWQNREWVTTETGRAAMIGRTLHCGWCEQEGAAR